MRSDNPAARLLKILEEGKNKQSHLKGNDVWEDLLNVDTSEPALLMCRLGKVMTLPEKILIDIKEYYPHRGSENYHWVKQLKIAFSRGSLSKPWSDFIVNIDQHTMDSIGMLSDMLDAKITTKVLSDSEINEMKEKIEQLIKEAIDSKLDDSIKKYIVRCLRKITFTIDEYQISGATPIVESIESTLGHVLFDENYRKNIKDTDFGNKFVLSLSAVASVLTIVTTYRQLPETFKYLLGN